MEGAEVLRLTAAVLLQSLQSSQRLGFGEDAVPTWLTETNLLSLRAMSIRTQHFLPQTSRASGQMLGDAMRGPEDSTPTMLWNRSILPSRILWTRRHAQSAAMYYLPSLVHGLDAATACVWIVPCVMRAHSEGNTCRVAM